MSRSINLSVIQWLHLRENSKKQHRQHQRYGEKSDKTQFSRQAAQSNSNLPLKMISLFEPQSIQFAYHQQPHQTKLESIIQKYSEITVLYEGIRQ